jgi:hypothetical protein
MTTALAYLVSPDREAQLFLSLATALFWSAGVDRVVIFCVGSRPSHWQFADPRVEVREVPALFGGYFLGNKVYASEVEAERVLFLDADTLVLRPLERLWAGWSCDFRARPANAGFGPRWKHETWIETFRHLGAAPLPMFNSGVLLFQNCAHQRIRGAWRQHVSDYLEGRYQEPLEINRHQTDQWALSLAVGRERLAWSILGPTEHTFGWLDEPIAESVVLHTSSGGDHFQRYRERLNLDVPEGFLISSR